MKKANEQIVWSAPPERGRKSKYEYFWEALKKKPGAWALYPGANCGNFEFWKTRGFQAVRRKEKVYCRFMGKSAGKDVR